MLRLLGGGLIAAALFGSPAARASDQPGFILRLNGPLGAQFAGYYVADYQGFYEEAEVAVTLAPAGVEIDPARIGPTGIATLDVERMPAALHGREQGEALVNIGQFFARPAVELVCRKDSGVTTLADLRGRRVGLWTDGDRAGMLAWLAGQGVADGVEFVDQDHDPSLLLQNEADCISARSWDERAQLGDANVPPEDLVVLAAAEHGPAPLEEGIWAPAELLKSPHAVRALGGFLYAARRGWSWARENPVEAVRIVQEYDQDKTLEEKPQVRRMHEINRLTEGSGGMLDPAAFQATVDLLLAAPGERAITRPPEAAWSHGPAEEAGLDEPE
ncbi:MAG: ABC transporter substrate-binding protein [Geminicoccaceae bacterium]